MTTSAPRELTCSRVAVVCDYALDYLGGAQTALAQQVAALRRAGAEVAVVAPSGPAERHRAGHDRDHDRVHVPSTVTVPWVRLPLVRNSPRLQRRLEEIFCARRIEVVHLHSELGVAAAAVAVARRLRIPVVHTVHTFFWQTDLPVQRALGAAVPPLHRWLTGLRSPAVRLADRPGDSALRQMTLTVARHADVVVSPSRHQAERLRAAGLPRVQVVPNALSTVPSADPLTRVTGPLRLLWVGRCVPEKRLLPFVEAAGSALDRVERGALEVHVVGEGEQLQAARRAAEGHSEIVFHGRVDHESVQRLLHDAHVTVLTSYGFDNQPMTVVESIMALRGVVYCDPALTEGLQGPGILAAGSSTDTLADLLVSLSRDPHPVISASTAAVAARREFSPETFVARVQQTYAAAAQQSRTNSSIDSAARPGAS